MHANSRQEIDTAISLLQLETGTGDTLCGEKTTLSWNQWNSQNQLSTYQLNQNLKLTKMTQALVKLQEEDPTFHAHTDEETGQVIIGGMGELHLDILVDRMKKELT